jgi:hypothetical protein
MLPDYHRKLSTFQVGAYQFLDSFAAVDARKWHQRALLTNAAAHLESLWL